MKKSKSYFIAAVGIWVLGIVYMMMILFGPKYFTLFNTSFFSGFTPFIGFVFIFIGIFIGKKGSELYNIENGREASYRPPLTKVQKAMPPIMAIFLGIIAIITFIAVTLSNK